MSYLEITIRILGSLFAGGLIGLERESKHRPAGFKTHMLVSLGAATIMVLSRLMYERYQVESGFLIDPTRMSAQIVSGIGFLGAGTIIHYGVNVRGLTTAASLWATATLGMVIGAGFYFLAFVVFASMFITLIIFSKLSRKIQNNPNHLELLITLTNKPKALGYIHLYLSKINAKIIDMDFINSSADLEVEKDLKHDEIIHVRLIIKPPHGTQINDITEALLNINGITAVDRL